MKPLTLEETRLKEEMKERCLAKGQYIDENAKSKFEMLCHLEDFEVQYWKLQQENKQLKEVIDKAIEYLTSYSSIHTIQFGTENDSLNDIELNKTLDEKTLNEMTNRYLKVHDKLLDILKEVSE